MSQNLENHVNLLKKEIYDITRNINNVGNKNHTTVTNIVKRLKNFTTDFTQNDFPLNYNINKTNLYTEQNKPNIKSLKQNYRKKNNFNYYRNKSNNCYFQNGSNTNLNIDQQALRTQANDSTNYNKKYTLSNNIFQNYTHRNKYDDIKKEKSKNLKNHFKSKGISSIDNINQRPILSSHNRGYKFYDEFQEKKEKTLDKRNKISHSVNKDVYIKKNNVRYNKIEKMKNILKCDDNEACINKIKTFDECFSFVEKIQNIYNKSNNNSDYLNGGDLNNILNWINHLAYENKYEKFCLSIMKENNIANFNDFQKKIYDLINNSKKENYFLNDIKKILCSDNNNDYGIKSRKRCKTTDRMTIENFDDIILHE